MSVSCSEEKELAVNFFALVRVGQKIVCKVENALCNNPWKRNFEFSTHLRLFWL